MTYEFKIKPEREIGIHLGPGTLFVRELQKYEKQGIKCVYKIRDKLYSADDGITPIVGADSETDITMIIESELTEEQKQEIKENFQSAICFNLF